MKILTLSFLIKEDKILLAMKKRGFGDGKWNGYGGKLAEGESIEDGAVREIQEEGNVAVQKEDLLPLGVIDFYFSDKPEWDQRVHIFRVEKWMGEPEETEEMKPEWFAFDKIPWESMWKGDDSFITKVIAKQTFSGTITFGEEGKKLHSIKIN